MLYQIAGLLNVLLIILFLLMELKLDYESGGQEWKKMQRYSASDWNRNLETILRWSPFSSEADLLQEVILLFLLSFCHILVVEVSELYI